MRLAIRGVRVRKLTIGYIVKKVRDLYYNAKVFTEGYGIRAKIKLIPHTAYRVFYCIGGTAIAGTTAHVAEHMSSTLTKSRTSLLMEFAPDVVIKNRNGLFKCRKGSGDIWITSEECEIDLTRYFKKVQSGIFVDIGANVGRYTVKLAKQIGNKGKVVAIECDPENYEALIENIKLNKLDNVYAFNLACYDREEDITLFMASMKYKVFSSIKRDTSGMCDRTLTVHGTTLDNILKGLGVEKVDVVKIDVEGAEQEVLTGMKETIARSNNIEILFEAWDDIYLEGCKKILYGYGLIVEDKEIESRVYRARRNG